MEALLNHWHRASEPLPVLDAASVAQVRARVRAVGGEAALPVPVLERLVTAASELAHNQVRHAGRGWAFVERIERAGVAGVEVTCADRGPGLADPTGALRGTGGSSAGGLGFGFSTVFRLAEEVDVDSRLAEGTCVSARSFAAPVPRARQVAILARPYPGEPRSGDDAAFRRTAGGLRLFIADGLGHGREAREASARAVAVLDDLDDRNDPSTYLVAAHARLAGTRGAVAAALRIDEALELASIGNIGCRVLRRAHGRSLPAQPGTLGGREPLRKVMMQREPLGPRDVVVLFSDGLSSRLHADDRPELMLDQPLALADHLLRTFGQANDDALVIVIR